MGAFLFAVLLAWLPALAPAQSPQAAVASAHPLATAAGVEILEAGGNAFDAAVAVSAALAVVEPYSSGIGGGGFWLLHRASDGRQVMVDGRERAPLAAHRDMYLDAAGQVVPGLSMDGPLAAGIPGEPAALAHIARHYGRLPLARSLAPAIRLARDGFEVDGHYRRMAKFRHALLQKWPESKAVFLAGGDVPAPGWRLKQPDLARTLEALARDGRDGFYAGPVAERLVAGVRRAGGIWRREDLEAYRVVEREPIRFRYRDLTVVSAAPPSSGGVALATLLNILSAWPLDDLDAATRTHLVVEAMRRAYRDRAQYLGDPDFVAIPLARLLHPWYAAGLRASLREDRATPSDSLPGRVPGREGFDTTHLSVIDAEGNRVAATLSINYPFGSGFVAPGTGVLLNDEMDDFSAKPGVPNAYGLVGAEANAIAPGKRPLSSMSPTFVESGRGVAVLGTPGGSRIITMVALAILDLAAGNGPAHWVSLPRFHHQYLPDEIQHEPGALAPAVADGLRRRGHRL
ncbi:MAG TPA: gamma-glutamyltransferase, partial [Gammaproteobacteria bacterium]|nr:gamma-glutamyltransferase [Gammaproteobacteria bacterium]